jgi:hypothetical protein
MVSLLTATNPVQAVDQTVCGTAEKLGTTVAYNAVGVLMDPFCVAAKGYDQWAGNSSGAERVVRGVCGGVWGFVTSPLTQWVPRGARAIGDVVTCLQDKKQYSLKPCQVSPEANQWLEATVLPF